MKNAFIVTDLGYGDSGKGTTTDHLSRQAHTLVVRHCGGPQAGHNVVTVDGKHHCFSQYGAGTLAGAGTFLSRFMLVNPLNMMIEAEHLQRVAPYSLPNQTYVDLSAKVITPWQVAYNRVIETARGKHRHGSCGQGVGVAAAMGYEHPELTIQVRDLGMSKLHYKLEIQRKWLLELSNQTGLKPLSPEWRALCSERATADLVKRYNKWLRTVHCVPSPYLSDLINQYDQVVFEGAQGVLLDEWFGFHPHTTYSTTTHKHALKLLQETKQELKVTRLGVIRAVTTRHGEGPHPTFNRKLTETWKEPHNTTGTWQGSFRVGYLDLVAHRYAVQVSEGIDQVVVTHLDKVPSWTYVDQYIQMQDLPMGKRGNLKFQGRLTDTVKKVTPILSTADSEDKFLGAIERSLGPIGLLSYGPTTVDKVPVISAADGVA